MTSDLPPLYSGTAAEHLVCADLWLRGFRAYLAPQACPYDVAVDMPHGIVRLQVKSTLAPRAIPQRVGHYPAYVWQVRRVGRDRRRDYAPGDFDMLALVAIDTRRIAYVEPEFAAMTIHIRTHDDHRARGRRGGGKSGRTFDQHAFDIAFARWGA